MFALFSSLFSLASVSISLLCVRTGQEKEAYYAVQ